MAESEDIDTMRVEEIFEQNKSIIYECMANNVQKKKTVLELKSKIYAAEEQKSKLIEYIKLLETIIKKGSKYEEFISNLNSAIEEGKNSIIDIKKDIAVLESEKRTKPKPTESKINLVKSMKKSLSEMNNKYVDWFIEKEKRLLELKRQIKEHDSPNALKEKQELDGYIKEHELLKAKNLRLKEMMALNMEQKI